jgi:hypothetical protein
MINWSIIQQQSDGYLLGNIGRIIYHSKQEV